MTEFIRIPFASSGDKNEIPDTDASGAVNWSEGYPADYAKDPETDPSAKRIGRENFNGILNSLSTAINEIQVNGGVPYITAADNGGSAYAYGVGALVHYNGGTWINTVDANTNPPSVANGWVLTSAKGKLINIRVISTSTVYNSTAGTQFIKVKGVGGGGAGGSAGTNGSGTISVGSAGGAGGYGEALITSGFDGQTITIGAGGTPAISGGGGAGGATTFGSLLTFPGGQGGAVTQVATSSVFSYSGQGLGGAVATGSALYLASKGAAGANGIAAGSVPLAAIGTLSPFGAGSDQPAANVAGTNSVAYGTGGPGTATTVNNSAKLAGAGAKGVIIIEEYA